MSSEGSPIDPGLWSTCRSLAVQAVAALRERKASGGYISPHLNYPKLHSLDNGMPSIYSGMSDGPPHYDFTLMQYFRKDGASEYEEWDSYREYINYARSSHEVMSYFNPNYQQAQNDDLTDRVLTLLPFEVMDRYLNIEGVDVDQINEQVLLSIYLELEFPIFREELPVSAVVPLVLTAIDVDHLDVQPNMRIERLSDEEQLARSVGSHDDSNVAMNKWLVHAATHAIVVDGLKIKHQHRWDFDYLPVNSEVTDLADSFVRALAIAQNRTVGYAQIYYRPAGWARDFTAGLPPIVGNSFFRRYPPHFDNSWRNSIAPLTVQDCQETVAVFKGLASCEARVKLAARRLGMGLLRESEEDAILDYCIGLEAVFGDLGPGETTYKLAMRGAKVLSPQLEISEADAFTCFKKIYGYRSAVAHGKSNAAKQRLIKLRDDFTVLADEAARELLRMGLIAVLSNPKLTVEFIDRNLLLNSDPNPVSGS